MFAFPPWTPGTYTRGVHLRSALSVISCLADWRRVQALTAREVDLVARSINPGLRLALVECSGGQGFLIVGPPGTAPGHGRALIASVGPGVAPFSWMVAVRAPCGHFAIAMWSFYERNRLMLVLLRHLESKMGANPAPAGLPSQLLGSPTVGEA